MSYRTPQELFFTGRLSLSASVTRLTAVEPIKFSKAQINYCIEFSFKLLIKYQQFLIKEFYETKFYFELINM